VRKQKKSEADKVAEAEKMGAWLANYYEIDKEMKKNEEKKSE